MTHEHNHVAIGYKTSQIKQDSITQNAKNGRNERTAETQTRYRPKRTIRSQAQTVQNARQQTSLQAQESDEGIQSNNDSSENESDYGTTVKGRAPKRRRHAQATRKALGKKKAKCFDLLFSMPVDIIFEGVGHLGCWPFGPSRYPFLKPGEQSPPKNVAFSERLFNLEGRAKQCWGPDCSPGFSEPRWASLLFGRPFCEQCGTTNVRNIEFGIRRRVCIRCKKQHLVSAVRFEKVFPHYESSIMDMVPYTRSGGWKCWSRSPGKFFWVSDIERIVSEWAVLQRDIHMYVKGARAAAAAYRKQKIDEAERIAQHAKVCDDWLRYYNMQLQMEADRKREGRVQEIQGRLLELGYDNRDIPSFMFNMPSFQKETEFTDQFWARIRPKLVEIVESNRDDRLERERARLWVERLTILRSLYVEYAKSLAPLQWCYLPNIYELAELPIFRDILEADSSIDVSRESFLPATGQLSTLISEWISAKKGKLISMLEPSSSRTVDHPLDLATSVFVCTSQNCHNEPSGWWLTSKVLISWEAIAAHSCQRIDTCLYTSYNSTTLGVSQLGASIASSLVRLASLDPSSATIAEMDALGLRFACLQCPPVSGRRLVTGYPWKSAVEHGMMTEHANWYRMSPEETQRIKQSEKPLWDEWRMKSNAMQHLSEIHHITSPTVPSDLFWYPGKNRIDSVTLASTEIIVPMPSSDAI
ncbi:hypothetical protein BD779DRAFT_1676612 [Infundibulicybe gibba]|nr:hypothetical protein BD779DRAFT_1676612 [Infundibulicybe gibba]